MASIFKKIFSMSLQCPYCGKDLSNPPKSKGKCPFCKKIICVRSLPPKYKPKLYTESQVKELKKEKEESRKIKMIENWGKLEKEKIEASKKNDLHKLKMISFEMALQLHQNGKPSFKKQQEVRTAELIRYRDDGGGKIKKVKILATKESCDICKRQGGKIFTIEEALKTMPLPVRGCKHKLKKGAIDGWCRCWYSPIFE